MRQASPPVPYLSPYVRPVLVRQPPGAGGGAGRPPRLVIENCIRGRPHLPSDVEALVLKALWPPQREAAAQLAVLRQRLGDAAIEVALAELERCGLLYPSAEACEAAFVGAITRYLPDVPMVDQVELTTHCPMRCGFCPRGIEGGMRRGRAHMSFALFERLLEQLASDQPRYRPLELDLLGESLLHPELERFVRAATDRGLPTELSVNPSLLAPRVAAGLLSAGLSRLIVSLDGMSDATLQAIRGPAASYVAAERNLRALIELAHGRRPPPDIVVQMIALRRNEHEREAFLSTWDGTGASFVRAYVKPLDGPDPDTGRPSATPTRHLCTFPFASVSILVDGSVVPCCRDAQGDYVLGNLHDATLKEIWHGERAMALRRAYVEDGLDAHPLCGPCAFQRRTFRETVAERSPENAVFDPFHAAGL